MLREAAFVRRRQIEVVPRDIDPVLWLVERRQGFFCTLFKNLDGENDPSAFTFSLSCATL